jgi:Fe-Mn family superoxide dismutase
MAHTLAPLPYAYDALEPFYDKQTLEIHHGKHHQTYVNNLNALLEGHPDLQAKSLDALLADLSAIPEGIRQKAINQGGGVWNHNLFWNTMGPNKGGVPTGKVAAAIDASFGSFDAFKAKFKENALAMFGSGWTFLIAGADGSLSIKNYGNQTCPLSDGLKPILVIDVWEHAYYLKFQNRRPDWVDSWWGVVNWDAVAAQLG